MTQIILTALYRSYVEAAATENSKKKVQQTLISGLSQDRTKLVAVRERNGWVGWQGRVWSKGQIFFHIKTNFGICLVKFFVSPIYMPHRTGLEHLISWKLLYLKGMKEQTWLKFFNFEIWTPYSAINLPSFINESQPIIKFLKFSYVFPAFLMTVQEPDAPLTDTPKFRSQVFWLLLLLNIPAFSGLFQEKEYDCSCLFKKSTLAQKNLSWPNIVFRTFWLCPKWLFW